MITLPMRPRHLALLFVPIAVILFAPAALRSQTSISGSFTDISAKVLPASELRSLLQQSFDAARVPLPRGGLDAIMRAYDAQPDAEIVVFDPASGRTFVAQLAGRANFSVGAAVDASRVCGAPCSGFENARMLRLTAIQATVQGPELGSVEVSLARNSRAAGVIEPETGRAFVQWPVTLRVPRSQLFEQSFTTEAVFSGYGQMRGDGLLVVDVARIQAGGRDVFVGNKNCHHNCDGPPSGLRI